MGDIGWIHKYFRCDYSLFEKGKPQSKRKIRAILNNDECKSE